MQLKTVITLGILLFFSQEAFLQIVDFDKVVAPMEVRPKSFPDYLVQLAWNNSPKNQKLYNQLEIAKYDTRLAKKTWTQDVFASFNLNEISLSNLVYGDRLDLPVFYPIYNFGASINLGTFVYRPIKVKSAQEKEKMAVFDINQQKLIIRRDVLESYENLKRTREVLKVRLLAEQDAFNSYLLISEKFKNNNAQFEDFNAASSAYYSSQEASISARSEVVLAKIKLEELIGIKFEDAQKMGPKEK